MQTNNKLREALQLAKATFETLIKFQGDEGFVRTWAELGRDAMLAALAAPATAEKSSAVGDAAKLREALIEILEYIERFHKYITPGKGKKLTALFAVADTIRDKARAALAEPPRQCDVGTAEEQSRRFDRVCSFRFTGNCAGCQNPLDDSAANGVGDCALFWAQMPYKEGGAK